MKSDSLARSTDANSKAILHRPPAFAEAASRRQARPPKAGLIRGTEDAERGRFSRSHKASSSNYLKRYELLIWPGNYPGQIKNPISAISATLR